MKAKSNILSGNRELPKLWRKTLNLSRKWFTKHYDPVDTSTTVIRKVLCSSICTRGGGGGGTKLTKNQDGTGLTKIRYLFYAFHFMLQVLPFWPQMAHNLTLSDIFERTFKYKNQWRHPWTQMTFLITILTRRNIFRRKLNDTGTCCLKGGRVCKTAKFPCSQICRSNISMTLSKEQS